MARTRFGVGIEPVVIFHRVKLDELGHFRQSILKKKKALKLRIQVGD
jgi:hypothetical protein